MPIYEFRCRVCRKKTTVLMLSYERVKEVQCDHCGSADLEKLWSRFASPKSEEARLEALADDSMLAGVDENDPASVARFVKKMGEAMGEDLGEDFEAALDEEMSKQGEGEESSSEPGGV